MQFPDFPDSHRDVVCNTDLSDRLPNARNAYPS